MAAKYLIDTCIFRHWAKRRDPAYSRIMNNASQGIVLPIVSVGEVIYGWHKEVTKKVADKEALALYDSMQKAIAIFQDTTVLPFDNLAMEVMTSIRPGRGHISASDLRIASIAINYNLILVTNNTNDFSGIPDLMIEDWTK